MGPLGVFDILYLYTDGSIHSCGNGAAVFNHSHCQCHVPLRRIQQCRILGSLTDVAALLWLPVQFEKCLHHRTLLRSGTPHSLRCVDMCLVILHLNVGCPVADHFVH